MKTIYPLFFTTLLCSTLIYGEKPGATDETAAPESKEAVTECDKADGEDVSVTHHSGTFGGESIEYTATAGTMVISKKEADPKAKMFYVAYTKDDIADPATRPIVYCFNGGPGSASVWLHLGGLGPKRVHLNPDGTMPKPPFRIKDNPASILRVADLVFIDPVSTGFSRAEDKDKAGEFHGIQGDLDSMAEFIRLYTSRNERWLSPKFLAGESYGAFRAAGLASVLQDDFALYLNGVVLVSGVLDFDTLRGSDLSHITFLPALCEVAAYHGKLEKALLKDPAARRREVEAFANGPYVSALLAGHALDPIEKQAIAEQVARFIGIDVDWVLKYNLRVTPWFFEEELLKEEGKIIGRFDGRITMKDGDLAASEPDFDPSAATVFGAFSAAQNDYLRRELGYETDLVYEVLTAKVRPWNYGKQFIGQPVTILPQLASVLSENPTLKVLVNCGYQDLATPSTAIRHSMNHLKIAPDLLDNIQYTYYEGGHMMYTIEASNTAWNNDIARFIEENAQPD